MIHKTDVQTNRVWFPRWEELHALASEPVENHVFFAEDFYDAVNGLYTTLSTFSVCSAVPQGQWVSPAQDGIFVIPLWSD